MRRALVILASLGLAVAGLALMVGTMAVGLHIAQFFVAKGLEFFGAVFGASIAGPIIMGMGVYLGQILHRML